MTRSPLGMPYDRVADEYYDPARHPTCDDFRRATRLLLVQFIDAWLVRGATILELGAGRSLVAEILTDRGVADLGNLTLTDGSATMLEYSRTYRARGARLQAAAVEALDCEAASFDMVVSCLGDPYNTPILWRQVERLLKPGGSCFYSSPSFAWSSEFRGTAGNTAIDGAQFSVRGELVTLPSFIYPKATQARLITAAGLHVADVLETRIADLEGGVRSPKLVSAIGPALPIISAYFVSKP